MIKIKSFIIAILMILPFFGIAQDLIYDMDKIMIHNVTVIDQNNETEDISVIIRC